MKIVSARLHFRFKQPKRGAAVKVDFFKQNGPGRGTKTLFSATTWSRTSRKVATLKKPILIVDCFAGRGEFEDGEPGSPLIILSIIRKWREKGIAVAGEFIEADQGNFARLEEALAGSRDFAKPRHGTFDEDFRSLLPAKQNTVFLYVDPYSVKGLVLLAKRSQCMTRSAEQAQVWRSSLILMWRLL